MAIQINSGEKALIKVTALTPANFGMQWGAVAVDSPTQVDAQYGLPFIPDSAIKGVLAARQELAGTKTPIFGKSDDWDKPQPVFGAPAKIIFGNGYAVMLPVRFEDGQKAFIVPLNHLLYFQKHAGIEFFGPGLRREIIQPLLYEDSKNRKVAISLKENFSFVSSIDISFLLNQISKENFISFKAIVQAIVDNAPDNVLLVGANTASQLWKKYSEKRTQIQINEKKVTKNGSLRKIELIPDESVFISFVTNFSDQLFQLPELISAGAWEKNGFGWFYLSKIKPINKESVSSGNIQFEVNCTPLLENNIMKSMFQAVKNAGVEENIARKIKSIIHNFGYYWKRYGLEAALSFELAKAKPDKTTDSPESFSHRWFLKQVLDLAHEPNKGKSKYPELKIEALTILKDCTKDRKFKIKKMEKRLDWLRRFSELEFSNI